MNIFQKIMYLPDYLNGYGMGNPHLNGEYRFLKKYIKNNMLIFDVGANIGEYTEYLIQNANNLEIHTFEPVPDTFDELQRRISIINKIANVHFNNFGLSDKVEDNEIIIYDHLAGSNSLYLNPEVARKSKFMHKVKINLSTVDEYISKNNISEIDFMKIDVEGYEANVLLGAGNSFNKKIIKAVQFEYGGFWKNSTYSLVDICTYLSGYSFKIFRLTPWGEKSVTKFDKRMNNYKHSNYIALH